MTKVKKKVYKSPFVFSGPRLGPAVYIIGTAPAAFTVTVTALVLVKRAVEVWGHLYVTALWQRHRRSSLLRSLLVPRAAGRQES